MQTHAYTNAERGRGMERETERERWRETEAQRQRDARVKNSICQRTVFKTFYKTEELRCKVNMSAVGM